MYGCSVRGSVVAVVVAGASVTTLACSSDDDGYLDEVQTELSTATFRCGQDRCALHHEYCVVKWYPNGTTQGVPAAYACETVPPQCADRSVCRCLGATQCYEERGRVVIADL